jgi:hypothetical protein
MSLNAAATVYVKGSLSVSGNAIATVSKKFVVSNIELTPGRRVLLSEERRHK